MTRDSACTGTTPTRLAAAVALVAVIGMATAVLAAATASPARNSATGAFLPSSVVELVPATRLSLTRSAALTRSAPIAVFPGHPRLASGAIAA